MIHYREAFETEADLAVCASLAGRLIFKSHLHSGQRVATEYTIRPNAAHFWLPHTLIFTSCSL